MKKLIIVAAMLLSSTATFANDPGKCQATTKAGTPCKRNAAAGSTFCKQHDPNSLRCGAKTVAGGTCKKLVKVAGTHCKTHS